MGAALLEFACAAPQAAEVNADGRLAALGKLPIRREQLSRKERLDPAKSVNATTNVTVAIAGAPSFATPSAVKEANARLANASAVKELATAVEAEAEEAAPAEAAAAQAVQETEMKADKVVTDAKANIDAILVQAMKDNGNTMGKVETAVEQLRSSADRLRGETLEAVGSAEAHSKAVALDRQMRKFGKYAVNVALTAKNGAQALRKEVNILRGSASKLALESHTSVIKASFDVEVVAKTVSADLEALALEELGAQSSQLKVGATSNILAKMGVASDAVRNKARSVKQAGVVAADGLRELGTQAYIDIKALVTKVEDERQSYIDTIDKAVGEAKLERATAARGQPVDREHGCEGIKAVYHRDRMAPNGFGCQYNHWVAFMVLALSEGRVPVEEGKWTLGCPVASLNQLARLSSQGARGEEGFEACWSDLPDRGRHACKTSPDDMYRKEWEHKDMYGKWPFAQVKEMFAQKDADEWHLDADVIRWAMMREGSVECSDGVSSSTSSWRPPVDSAFVQRVCHETGLERLGQLDFARYITQRVQPTTGIAAARAECRAQWRGHKVLAVHIRRTDKLVIEDVLHPMADYVAAARNKGWAFDLVFIATDDAIAVRAEAEELKAKEGLEYSMLDRAVGEVITQEVRSTTDGTTELLREVACLVEAEHFIGSRKSNIPWLVQTLRSHAPESACGLEGESLSMP